MVVDHVRVEDVEDAGDLGRMGQFWHRIAKPVSEPGLIGGDEPLRLGGVAARADECYLVAAIHQGVHQIGDDNLDPAVTRGWNPEIGRCDHRDMQAWLLSAAVTAGSAGDSWRPRRH